MDARAMTSGARQRRRGSEGRRFPGGFFLAAAVIPAILALGAGMVRAQAGDSSPESREAPAPPGLRPGDGFTPYLPPALGLGSGLHLGLPETEIWYQTGLYPHYGPPLPASIGMGAYSPYRPRYGGRYRLLLGYGYGAPYYPGYYSDPWYPWYGIPQTRKFKAHYPAIYETPRLGLQYTYPYAYPFGLQIPEDPDAPIVPPWPGVVAEELPPGVEDAIALMRQGQYADAGRRLAGELKRDAAAPLEVYLVIAEVLMASGKFSAAARVFKYGLDSAPDLAVLDGADISRHFPDRKTFQEKMKALSEAISPGPPEVGFLHAAFRLLSGDRSAMDGLEQLQGMKELEPAARRLYLHFLDLLFQPPAKPEAGAGQPQDGAGGGEGKE